MIGSILRLMKTHQVVQVDLWPLKVLVYLHREERGRCSSYKYMYYLLANN